MSKGKSRSVVRIMIVIVLLACLAALIYDTHKKYEEIEAEWEATPKVETFNADDYDPESTFFLPGDTAYLKIELPGRASDNIQEIARLLEAFEASANSVIVHWDIDQEDSSRKHRIGYLHGIWIEYEVRPVDYR